MKRALRRSLVLLATAFIILLLSGCTLQDYQLVKYHRVPDWYNNAKFGVMIQSGPSSVPAWAPVEGAEPGNLLLSVGPKSDGSFPEAYLAVLLRLMWSTRTSQDRL